MQQPYFTLARLKEGKQVELPSYLENALELLDEPGEWYLDRSEKVVYYQPEEGEDMESVEVIAPVVEKLMELRGDLDHPVRNIRFEGITFSHASWLRPSRIGHVDLQANFVVSPHNVIARAGGYLQNLHNEAVKSPAHIVLRAAQSIVFERCRFTKLGGAGIDLEHGSRDNLLSGCEFFDISGSAIQVGDVIDHHPKDLRAILKNNRIVNNYIHHVGSQYSSGVGVFVGYTDGTVIAHNEICDLPYSAISIGWGWGEEDVGGGAPHYYQPFLYDEPTPSRNNVCENNHIHGVLKERSDGGGVYTLGNMPGSVIRGNLIHDNPNWFGGVYLDEGSGYIEVTGNAVYNVEKPMNYNNKAQNRDATCNEHDNYFDIKPGDKGFPTEVSKRAGLEPAYGIYYGSVAVIPSIDLLLPPGAFRETLLGSYPRLESLFLGPRIGIRTGLRS